MYGDITYLPHPMVCFGLLGVLSLAGSENLVLRFFSLSLRSKTTTMEAEKRDRGNEVGKMVCRQCSTLYHS